MSNPKVSIIILNYNGINDTIECLQSLEEIAYENYEVFIVDNASTNNDFALLEEKYKNKYNLILADDNNGFSAGNNIAIKNILDSNKSDYILLLNNDTIVQRDFLTSLVETCESNQEIGIAAPRVNYYYQPGKLWSAGGYISKIRGTAIDYKIHIPSSSYRTFASGCCLLIKIDVFKKVGLMDENYFLYVEDADFCYRTIREGFKIIYVDQSIISHKVNKSTTRINNALPIYYTTRNRLYFSKKLLGEWYYLVFVFISITILIKSLYWLIFKKKIYVKAVFIALTHFLSNRLGKYKDL